MLGFRKHILVIALAAAVAVSSAAAVAQSGAKSFLWKVQSGSAVLYLAGSVHALTAANYPLNPAYQRAFDASGALVEEIDLSEADPLSGGLTLLAKGMYTDGRTFSTAVSKETAAKVAARLTNSPFALDLIQPMKPWMVMMLLETLELQAGGFDANLGLDKFFYDKATAAKKTVIGLETAASQIDRFDKMPDAVQEQMLVSALAEKDAERANLSALISAWQRGDAPAMEQLMLQSFQGNNAAYASLITERNRNWMPQLEACFRRPSPCFVIVGAAHVIGPDGLLAMLRQKGYKIEQQ
jgi:uncharacterized protein YbaP (TraB family)